MPYQTRRPPTIGTKNNYLKSRLPRLGDTVEVWWDGNQQLYRGKIVKCRGRVHIFRFEIHYDDGDIQVHNLNEEWWRFGDTPDTWYEPGDVDEIKRDQDSKTYHDDQRDTVHELPFGESHHRKPTRRASGDASRKIKERSLAEQFYPTELATIHPVRCADGTDRLETGPKKEPGKSATATTLRCVTQKRKLFHERSEKIPSPPPLPFDSDEKLRTTVSETNICAVSSCPESAKTETGGEPKKEKSFIQTPAAIDTTLPPRKRKMSRIVHAG